jgi:HTH-type transcriptional regulator/antitoxin HigA
MDMSEIELSGILGYCSRKSEILSGKRKLTLKMIRKLNAALHIPAEVLIQPY